MGKYVQWIEHKGVRILFLNGKGLAEAENFEAQEELKQELLRDRSSPPVLVDLSNTAMTQKTSGKSKEVAAATKVLASRWTHRRGGLEQAAKGSGPTLRKRRALLRQFDQAKESGQRGEEASETVGAWPGIDLRRGSRDSVRLQRTRHVGQPVADRGERCKVRDLRRSIHKTPVRRIEIQSGTPALASF